MLPYNTIFSYLKVLHLVFTFHMLQNKSLMMSSNTAVY